MKTLSTIIHEHIEWRAQVGKLAKADIKKTYSGTAFGWGWALVKPTVTILVFWFAFTVGGIRRGGEINGYPFVLWMMPGFMAWFFMSEMLTQGANCIRKYAYLVTKMKFPVSTIPTFTGIAKLLVHVGLMVIVCLFFVIYGRYPDLYWLQIFFYMALMFAFWVAWALFAGMLSAMSRDFYNLVNSLTTAVFWMSGIMWDISNVRHDVVRHILYFNPVTYFATGYRNCFIYKIWFWEQPVQLACTLFMTVLIFLLALWAYKKLIKEIPDVL